MSIAAIAGVMVLSVSSCLKDDSEAKRVEEKKILADYITTNYPSVEPSSSGLYFIETQHGTGDSIKAINWMEIKYTARLVSNNQVVMTSDMQIAKDNNIYLEGTFYGPTRLILGQIRPIALNEGIAKMKEGGKVRLIFPSDIGLGGVSNGNIPAYSSLIFDIELFKVIPDIKAYESSLMLSYLTAHNMSTDSTSTGIYFSETTPGTGDFPVDGKLVTVTYKAKLLNGTVFDNSGKSFSLTIGNQQVIPGFEEGVKLLRKGGSGTVVIPNYYAYGEYGRYNNSGRYVIPPFSTLVFDISVTSIAK